MSAHLPPAGGGPSFPTPPPTPPSSVPPPPYPYPPPGYPPPRPRDDSATLIVLLLVAFIVIPAILGVIVLAFFASFFGGLVPTGPIVILDGELSVDGNASIEVRLVSQEHPIERFGFRLEVNGTASAAHAFLPSGQAASLEVAGYALRLAWSDGDDDGQVSPGDAFHIGGAGAALPPDTAFTFTLTFSGSVLEAQESWSTP